MKAQQVVEDVVRLLDLGRRPKAGLRNTLSPGDGLTQPDELMIPIRLVAQERMRLAVGQPADLPSQIGVKYLPRGHAGATHEYG